ncbi:PREDICTED: pentatricopeptide repeat-containing protein At2g39620 isoform X2 [Tarenaya hassleriana]|nr:PREDICTED: pentatricopeptide repeat-containing protein At2g39620 isoform X2 [Tarenaya hassleriana]
MDLQEGIRVHGAVVDKGFESDIYVGSALVDMYGKVGDLSSARQLFDKMTDKDVVAWNAMVSGLAQHACPHEAFRFFRDMHSSCVNMDYISLFNLIPAVSKLGDVDVCRCLHCLVIKKGFSSVLHNGLIDMYCKCADVSAAKCIFENMTSMHDSSWSTMMSGYAYNMFFEEILDLFDRMKNSGVRMNKVAAVSALQAAASLGDLKMGTEIHKYVELQGMFDDVLVATSLMNMYAKCGELEKAEELFQKLKDRDVVAWSAIISSFEQTGHCKDVLSLFRKMMSKYVKPNAVTLISVLPACAELTSSRLGKSIHCYAVKANLDSDLATATAIVSMYAKCGLSASALKVFERVQCKDAVVFNALLDGYTQNGDTCKAYEVYRDMKADRICPDPGTMVGLLHACAVHSDYVQGSCIYGQIIKHGFATEWNVEHALIDMFAKCGALGSAISLFSSYEFKKSVVSWNIMITGYMLNGQAEGGIATFRQMRLERFQPNIITFVNVLHAATQLAALREGMSIHGCLIKLGFQFHTAAGNSLVDMYAKCGMIGFSEKIFNEMGNKDIISWNTMLAAYAAHGLGDSALSLFSFMQGKEFDPDCVSFLSVLSACRHAGLVEEGKLLFNSMHKDHNIEANLEHYACMVDLLGRAGLFDEALDIVRTMTKKPDARVWGALFNSSLMHSSLLLAEASLCQLAKLEPENPLHYAVLLKTRGQERRWVEAGSFCSRVGGSRIKKIPGRSWFEA